MNRLAAPAWFGVLAVGLVAHAAGADEPTGLAFFEQKIRPVLVGECYSCHSATAKALKGGLRLDTRAGVLAGGESGPSVVPGKPEESTILDALRHDGLAMPPKGKLPDAVVADFERWIIMGAPDPRAGAAVAGVKPAVGIDVEAGRSFWAYTPPRRHPLPAAADADWPATDVDRFVLAALEAKGLKPVGDADRATLARRVSFDLVGLPPTPEDVDAFAPDPSPAAYEAMVDRLLASPRFGERWGRHWMDVVRFAESITLRGQVFPNAWRYRDYVIDAFNADTPYDRFLREQLAGDLLDARSTADRRRQRVATTFLVLGNNNLEEQDKPQLVMDVVDEQLDTIGKAFLAQTIGCARCHDHKFDPIPTEDYYALAGILRNTRSLEHDNVSKLLDVPLPDGREAEAKRHAEAVAALEGRLKDERGRAGDSIRPVGAIPPGDLPGVVVDDTRARKVGAWVESQFTRTYVGSGYVHDDDKGKGEKTITFAPDLPATGPYEVWLAYSPSPSRSPAVPVTVMSADGEKTVEVDMRANPTIEGRFVSLGRYRFEKDGQSYVLIATEGTRGHVTADAVVFLPPAAVPSPARARKGDAVRALEDELKRLKAAAPKRERALSVVDEPVIVDTQVHVRGSVHTLGETVPRGFLRVATYGAVPPMPSNESGRRELAEWVAGESNPLTARVFVNRAWHWLFGAGIVRTTDNFGTTGELPTHPELLDELAVRFMEDGWSVKNLVRRLVLSRSYRLSTGDDPKGLAADPENRLHWRTSRRRLDAECLRDALLSVSGSLRPEMGGPTFPPDLAADYGFVHESTRRSVYAPVFRNALPDLFEVFDFADPSMVVGARNASTVAPQALYMRNHPFVIGQARASARRLLAERSGDDPARVVRAYRLTLGRPPTAAEARLASSFLAGEGPNDPEGAWAILFQALFSSIDFRYVN